jgi:transposase-like protein/IS1 family transposase
MTCYQEITCPKCGGNNIAKSGLSAHGVQRYRCQHPDCPTKTFMLNYRYRAYEPGIKAQVVEMAINSSGIRDTARVLKINKNTVISTLKKKASALVQVNPLYLKNAGQPREVRLERACEAAELDEQGSFVGNQSNPRWLWHAVDHTTNTVLAYVFGKRKDTVFQDLKALLAPFNISRYYTDDWGALTNATSTPTNRRWASEAPKRSNVKTSILEPGSNDWRAEPFAYQSWKKCMILLLVC